MRSEDDLGALVYLCNLAGAQVAGQNTDGREQTQLGQLGASKDAVEKGGGGERETERETETARNITAQQVMTWASRVSPLAEHAATLLLLHSELADAVAGSDLRKHDKSGQKSGQKSGHRMGHERTFANHISPSAPPHACRACRHPSPPWQ